jgi:hypothetical protein
MPACAAAPTNAAPCYPTSTVAGDALWMFEAGALNQAGLVTDTRITRMVLTDATLPMTLNVALPPQLVAGSPVTYSAPVTDNHELWSTAFAQDYGDLVYLPFGDPVMVGDGNRWDDNFTTSATAVLSLTKAIVARERAPAGVPAGAFAYATTVRAQTTDAAGNPSATVANNYIPATVDAAGAAATYGGANPPATLTTDWSVPTPAAAVTLCNGQGGTACNVAPGGTDVLSTTMTIQAQGASGVYNNPFGAAGTIFVYVNLPGADVTYYTADDSWFVIGSINAASAAITDNGMTRTYTWSFTVTSAMVAQFAAATNIGLVAAGLNDTTGTLLVSDPNVNVTVVNGT